MRSIGHKVDGRLAAMIDISKVTEDPDGSHMTDKEMIAALGRRPKNIGIYAVRCW